TVFSTPQTAGDEAFLLATNLRGLAAVISDANRVAAGQDAIKHLRTDYFVLDDGFQHLRLVRDLDIVTIDATNPWGGGRLLPEGRLREPLSGLSRAGCVVITRVDQAGEVESLRKQICNYSNCPVFTSRMTTRALVPVNDSPEPVATPVGVFCGVGNPASFFKQLRKEGYVPVFEKAMPDHHSYTQHDIDSIAQDAEGAGAKSLITTAKDAVKLQALTLSLPCFSLDVEISIDDAEEFMRLILSCVG
ncbi:MAG TPA: tetraacyldisaccharide 4'-kinase, partial [Pyrinomonadaceae bacterium]